MLRASFLAPRFGAIPDIPALDATHFTAICCAHCKRLPAMRRTAEAKHLDALVASGAWVDAMLALIAIELPDWQLRRLTFDDGEWHCALSTERNMPDWLDDAAEAHHPDMAMALMTAFMAVAARPGASHLTPIAAASGRTTDAVTMCCENYA